jgi:hypothetical protein
MRSVILLLKGVIKAIPDVGGHFGALNAARQSKRELRDNSGLAGAERRGARSHFPPGDTNRDAWGYVTEMADGNMAHRLIPALSLSSRLLGL